MRGRAPKIKLKKSQREGETGGKEIRDPIETNSNSRSLLLIAKQHTKHLPGKTKKPNQKIQKNLTRCKKLGKKSFRRPLEEVETNQQGTKPKPKTLKRDKTEI